MGGHLISPLSGKLTGKSCEYSSYSSSEIVANLGFPHQNIYMQLPIRSSTQCCCPCQYMELPTRFSSQGLSKLFHFSLRYRKHRGGIGGDSGSGLWQKDKKRQQKTTKDNKSQLKTKKKKKKKKNVCFYKKGASSPHSSSVWPNFHQKYLPIFAKYLSIFSIQTSEQIVKCQTIL